METDKAIETATGRIMDILIAGIRFQGNLRDIPAVFQRLERSVAGHIAGPPIFLYYYGYPGPEQDIEVCLPVDQPINKDGVQSRILESQWVISIRHYGAHRRLGESWRLLAEAMQKKRIAWGNGPVREVYLAGPRESGEDANAYITEIQIPMLLPEWMERLKDGIETRRGESVSAFILGDGFSIPHDAGRKEKAFWVQSMLERLDTLIPQHDLKHEILSGCSHRFPEQRINILRRLYLETGSLESVVTFMQEDRSENGANYYESPRLEGNVIRVTKNPYDVQSYRSAHTEFEKRLSYCHCPISKDAMLTGFDLSESFCHCGTGWYHSLWEGILERKVRVEIVRSLLRGHSACEFAIYLDE